MKQLVPQLVTLENDFLRVRLTNFGAAVFSFEVNENGVWEDIALTRNTLEEFMENRDYYGATVGRVANRIKNGCAVIGGKTYQLDRNDGDNSLHGGRESFTWKLW